MTLREPAPPSASISSEPYPRSVALAMLGEGRREASLWAAGSVVVDEAGPRFVWRSSALSGGIDVAGPGDVTLELAEAAGVPLDEASVIVAPRGALEKGRLVSLGAMLISPHELRVTSVVQTG